MLMKMAKLKHKYSKRFKIIAISLFAIVLAASLGTYLLSDSRASVATPADINNDNKVDIFDLSILLSNWNKTGVNTSDLNADSVVNIFDLSTLLSKWGSVTATTDPIVMAAGDIGCDPLNPNFNGGQGSSSGCRMMATSNLIVARPETAAVLTLGDTTNECGGEQAFQLSYDPSWGRVKSITHPIIGNHEYLKSGVVNGANSVGCDTTGQGLVYFNYFGAAAGEVGKGYYSFDIGTWHLIALNSQCGAAGGCGTGSAQNTWLKNDLAAHPNQCTLAYFHHPLFSQDTSGGTANTAGLPFWQLLYASGAELILDGHSHNYQRYAPMTPAGMVDDASGIVEIVSGTGGANHTSLDPAIIPQPVISNATTFGVLQLTLHSGSYDWKFIPESGGSFTDSGTRACH